MMENTKSTNKFLLFITIFLTSFLLGFYTSNNYKYLFYKNTKNENLINNNTINNGISNNNTFSSGSKNLVENLIKDNFGKKDLNLDLFWQVYNIVYNNYYSVDELKQKDLEYGIINGFVNSVGDKFSEFMDPKLTEEFENTLKGDFEGIGAVIETHELGVAVDRVIKGSPALNNGILKGDILIEANGTSLKGLNVAEAVNFIKGKAGTKVNLKILRAGENDFIKKEIIRQKIIIPSVDTIDMKDKDIGYITLNMFGENTSKEFLELLNTFNNDQIKGIIIDLRDNGGGYLLSAVKILSNFIEDGKVLVTTKYKNNINNTPYYSNNSGKIFDKKIVVLINENSASASEITAGALKDYNKAILVGEKSYGKGSVQEPFNLPDGSMLKLTIAKWYTPKDYSINHNGIEPDIKVKFQKEDYDKKYDRQLEEAKKILKKFIKFGNITLVVNEYNKENPNSGTGELIGSGNILNGTGSKK